MAARYWPCGVAAFVWVGTWPTAHVPPLSADAADWANVVNPAWAGVPAASPPFD